MERGVGGATTKSRGVRGVEESSGDTSGGGKGKIGYWFRAKVNAQNAFDIIPLDFVDDVGDLVTHDDLGEVVLVTFDGEGTRVVIPELGPSNGHPMY